MKIFQTYDEAVMHCVMNDIYPYKVHKHKSRPNTLYNWYLTTTKGKIIKNEKTTNRIPKRSK